MNWLKQRRSSKSAAVYIPIGALLIVLLTIFGTSGFLRIVEIEVSGAVIYSEEEIIGISGISPGDNLLFIDANSAAKRIQSAMPFINSAKVTRLPPGAIHIEVTESIAVAWLAFENEAVVIDSSGRVLQRSFSAPVSFIEIRGINPVEAVEGNVLKAELGSETQFQILLDVLSAIEREGLQEGVSFLDITSISNISFGYIERFRVVLGGPTNLRQKMASLPTAISEVDAGDHAGSTGTLKAETDGSWRFTKDN